MKCSGHHTAVWLPNRAANQDTIVLSSIVIGYDALCLVQRPVNGLLELDGIVPGLEYQLTSIESGTGRRTVLKTVLVPLESP